MRAPSCCCTYTRSKWLYFNYFFVLSSFGRFTSLYFLDTLELTENEIGIIFSVGTALCIFSTTFFSAVADYFQARKLVHAICVLIAIAASFLFLLHYKYPFGSSFHVALVLYSIYRSAVVAGLINLDAISLDSLGHNKSAWGNERLGGAYSWAIAHITCGLLMDYFDPGYVMPITGISAGCFHLILLLFWDDTKKDFTQLEASNSKDEAEEEGPSLPWKDVFALPLQSCSLATFFLYVFTAGICTSFVESLIFIFFEEDLNASKFLLGVSVVVTVSFEIPLFAFTAWWKERLDSEGMIFIATGAYVIRVLTYTAIPSSMPWLLLLAEPMHGVTFALNKTAFVLFIADRVPGKLQATGQNLMGVFSTLGTATGAGMGGYILSKYGANTLYRFGGALMLFIWFFHFWVHSRSKTKLKEDGHPEENKIEVELSTVSAENDENIKHDNVEEVCVKKDSICEEAKSLKDGEKDMQPSAI